MFIRYQQVRNAVLGVATTGIAGLAFFFGRGPHDDPAPAPAPTQLARQAAPVPASRPPTAEFSATEFAAAELPAAENLAPVRPDPRIAKTRVQPSSENPHPTAAPQTLSPQTLSPQERRLAQYRSAMKIATARSDPSGKGKDVLGPRSPWKLNLYDDDKDGTWDRGKLDYDRDEEDDEKWNFKQGRWEKDGGATIWDGSQWIPSEKNR